jgi:hypothetical protein
LKEIGPPVVVNLDFTLVLVLAEGLTHGIRRIAHDHFTVASAAILDALEATREIESRNRHTDVTE